MDVRRILLTLGLFFLIGCSWKKEICTIQNQKCVPIQTYEEWNKCAGPCTDIKLESKTKYYKPKKWIRPSPYVYP